jgi:hypothetical protein
MSTTSSGICTVAAPLIEDITTMMNGRNVRVSRLILEIKL